MRLPDDAAPRQILLPDWGAKSIAWSPDATRLLLVRLLAARPGPGLDPGLDSLWIMEADGRLREVYRPAGRATLSSPIWSPDGGRAIVWESSSTSSSFAADGVGLKTLLIDVASGAVGDLGVVLHRWAAWAPDGRLAYTRGGLRVTWENKELVLRDPTGRERLLRAPTSEQRVGLAPAWDPSRARLAWVSGPVTPGDWSGDGYMDGKGAGRRVAVIQDGNKLSEVACGGGRVVEGVRWSADGLALLLLCRKVGRDAQPLELWLHRLTDGTSAPLVTGLPGGGPYEAGGFGFYGAHPHITMLAAWSRAV